MAPQSIFFICLIAGVMLIGAEVFLPGAVMGIIGSILLLVAMGMAFVAFPAAGPFIAVGILFLASVVVALWIHFFPKSRMGKSMMVSTDLRTFKATETGIEALINKRGVALSPLRPAGFAQIEDKRVDVITRGEMIAKDVNVQVVAVEGNSVIVARV